MMGVKRCGLCKTCAHAADGPVATVVVLVGLLVGCWAAGGEPSLGSWCGPVAPCSLLPPSPSMPSNASRKDRRDWIPAAGSSCPWSIDIPRAPRSNPWVCKAERPGEACAAWRQAWAAPSEALVGLPVVGGCSVDDDDELEGAATSEVDDMLA
jgi:hypothetical protein